MRSVVFFFNDTATTEIYPLSLHGALPICDDAGRRGPRRRAAPPAGLRRAESAGLHARMAGRAAGDGGDRKSTRLNSSHANISYAVFCLKKKITGWTTRTGCRRSHRAHATL